MARDDAKLILIVDDEARMRRFMQMNLDLEGYRVIEASNGLEALDRVREDLPDLVLLDVMMPELDGFETLGIVRETSTVPVIMLTVRDDESDKVKGLELGVDGYMTKPYSFGELKEHIHHMLRRDVLDNHLVVFDDIPPPTVDAVARIDDIHAGSQIPFDKSFRDSIGFRTVCRCHENNLISFWAHVDLPFGSASASITRHA